MKTHKIIIALVLLVFGFNISAQDFKKTLKMEGRIMYDFNFLSAGDDYSIAGNEFRRIRIAAKGKVSENVSYSADFELTGGKIRYRNVFIKYTMPKKYGNITLGSFPEPTGLDMLTSSKYITFIERAMLVSTQKYGKYNAGIRYQNEQLFDGKIGVQFAYTFNGPDDVAHKDYNLESGANFISRIRAKIVENKKKKQYVHLAINHEYRNDVFEDYGYTFRTENRMGEKTTIETSGAFENGNDLGFELAANYKSLSLQGEYEISSIKTDVDRYKTIGYYGFVSYFVTGESRPYKNGVFSRVIPKNNFLQNKGLGAIELIARYSVMDLNKNRDLTNTDNNDYKVTNITLGLNWYLNSHSRFMYNFTYGDHNDLSPITFNGQNLTGHLFRFQVDF